MEARLRWAVAALRGLEGELMQREYQSEADRGERLQQQYGHGAETNIMRRDCYSGTAVMA